MAQPSHDDGLFAMVEFNYQDVFTLNPFSYLGCENHLQWCIFFYVTYLERFMQDEIKNIYYYEPEKILCDGIWPISNDVDYVALICNTYGIHGIIYIYFDHVRVGVEGWFYKGHNEDDDKDFGVDGMENGDNIFRMLRWKMMKRLSLWIKYPNILSWVNYALEGWGWGKWLCRYNWWWWWWWRVGNKRFHTGSFHF